MNKYEILTASEVLEKKMVQGNEKEDGRIPSFLGEFEYDGKIYDFDKDVLGGGFYRGVNITSGFSGQGKTTACIQMATRQAEAGYRVLYITQEQDDLEVVEKVLGILTGLPFKEWEDIKFKRKNEFKVEKEEALKTLNAYVGREFKIVHHSFKPKDLVTFIDEQKEHFDIIYIDNFQNCDTTPGKKVEELEYLSNSVMQIINTYKKCCLVWLSQLTSEGTQNPLKANINYSKKLEQDACVRLVVYKEKPEESWKKKREEDAPIDTPKAYFAAKKNRKASGAKLKEGTNLEFRYDTLKERIGSFTLETVEKRMDRRKKDERMVKTPADDTSNEEHLESRFGDLSLDADINALIEAHFKTS